MEQAPGQAVVQLRPHVPHSTTVVVSGWSDSTGAPHSPGGERGHELVSRRGALRLLNGGGFHQCPEVPVDRLFLGVDMLGKAAQKHCRSGNVLASPSELWGIASPVHDVVLDLVGATTDAAHRVTRVWCSVLH